MQRLSPKKRATSQSKSKPLLHKVLHTASFKAQRREMPRAKIVAVVPHKEDDNMEIIDDHVEESRVPQLVNKDSPLCATDPNAQLGTAWEVKDIGDCQSIESDVEDVNIRSLEITDHRG